MSKKVNAHDFNLMVQNILALYSQYLGIHESKIMDKIIGFNNQLDNQIKNTKTRDEKSIQLGQDDQTTTQHV